MHKQSPLDQIQRLNNQNLIRSIVILAQQPIKRIKQLRCDVPLEVIL
jgi:hypothetical protein